MPQHHLDRKQSKLKNRRIIKKEHIIINSCSTLERMPSSVIDLKQKASRIALPNINSKKLEPYHFDELTSKFKTAASITRQENKSG